MDKIIIKRDGLPPIAFTGEQIASADNLISNDGNRANRWTEIAIYRTRAGRYVAAVARRTIWQGEKDHFSAASWSAPAEIIDWLRDGKAELGQVSQEAVEKAAKSDPAFAAAWVEEVE